MGSRAHQWRRVGSLYNKAVPINPRPPLPSPWSDIPVELAGLVLARLPSVLDRARFAAVCRQWRAAAREAPPLTPPLPLLLLPDGAAYSFPRREPLRFPAAAGYAGACGNWLLYSGERTCFLWDPFANATVTLPPLSRFRLQYNPGDVPSPMSHGPWAMTYSAPTVTRVIICSSSRLVAALVRFELRTRVAVCQPDAASWWSICMDERLPMFSDIVFHKGSIFAIDYGSNDLYAIDVCVVGNGAAWVSGIQRVIGMISGRSYMSGQSIQQESMAMEMVYLVESCGDLLMVRRGMHGRWKDRMSYPFGSCFAPTGRNAFEVFKADFPRARWTRVTTVGDDQMLFLSGRQCRSFSVSQFGMPGDRIVFLENDDEEFIHWYDQVGSCSCSVYNMRDGRVTYALPGVSWKRGTTRATWLFPQRTELKLLENINM